MADKYTEKDDRSSTRRGSDEQVERRKESHDPFNVEAVAPNRLNAVFENPLADIPREQLMVDVTQFCEHFGLMEYIDAFKKGALVSQNPNNTQNLNELSDEDKLILENEYAHK